LRYLSQVDKTGDSTYSMSTKQINRDPGGQHTIPQVALAGDVEPPFACE